MGVGGQRSMEHGPAAALMQVWIFTPSPGTAVVSAPLRRSRTAPDSSGTTQPKQMPIRQPEGMSTPAASPASSSGVAPSASTTVPDLREGHRATLAGHHDVRAEPLGVQPVGHPGAGPVLLEGVEQAGRAAGPGLPRGPVGHDRVELGGVEQAVGVGVPLDEPDPAGRGHVPQLGTEDHVGRASGRCAARPRRASSGSRLRSIPITGVIPLPAVTNSTCCGACAGRWKSPVAWSSWMTVPGRARRTMWLLTLPSGIALTVIAIRPSRRGPEVSE